MSLPLRDIVFRIIREECGCWHDPPMYAGFCEEYEQTNVCKCAIAARRILEVPAIRAGAKEPAP